MADFKTEFKSFLEKYYNSNTTSVAEHVALYITNSDGYIAQIKKSPSPYEELAEFKLPQGSGITKPKLKDTIIAPALEGMADRVPSKGLLNLIIHATASSLKKADQGKFIADAKRLMAAYAQLPEDVRQAASMVGETEEELSTSELFTAMRDGKVKNELLDNVLALYENRLELSQLFPKRDKQTRVEDLYPEEIDGQRRPVPQLLGRVISIDSNSIEVISDQTADYLADFLTSKGASTDVIDRFYELVEEKNKLGASIKEKLAETDEAYADRAIPTLPKEFCFKPSESTRIPKFLEGTEFAKFVNEARNYKSPEAVRKRLQEIASGEREDEITGHLKDLARERKILSGFFLADGELIIPEPAPEIDGENKYTKSSLQRVISKGANSLEKPSEGMTSYLAAFLRVHGGASEQTVSDFQSSVARTTEIRKAIVERLKDLGLAGASSLMTVPEELRNLGEEQSDSVGEEAESHVKKHRPGGEIKSTEVHMRVEGPIGIWL